MEWKYDKLHKTASIWHNKHSKEERAELCISSCSTQLLTIRQLITTRQEQHRNELANLQKWEDNVAKQLRKLLKDKDIKEVENV